MCTNLEHVKKIDWCRDRRQGDGLVIAAGSRSGRVALVSFPNVKQAVDDDDDDEEGGGDQVEDDDDQVEDEDPLGSNSLERRPKLPSPRRHTWETSRKVSCQSTAAHAHPLRWNPIKYTKSPPGTRKTRKDDGCDPGHGQKTAKQSRSSYYRLGNEQVIAQPITSVGHGDTAMSLAWQPRKSAILAMVRLKNSHVPPPPLNFHHCPPPPPPLLLARQHMSNSAHFVNL